MRGSWDNFGFRSVHEHGYLLTCHELHFQPFLSLPPCMYLDGGSGAGQLLPLAS